MTTAPPDDRNDKRLCFKESSEIFPVYFGTGTFLLQLITQLQRKQTQTEDSR